MKSPEEIAPCPKSPDGKHKWEICEAYYHEPAICCELCSWGNGIHERPTEEFGIEDVEAQALKAQRDDFEKSIMLNSLYMAKVMPDKLIKAAMDEVEKQAYQKAQANFEKMIDEMANYCCGYGEYCKYDTCEHGTCYDSHTCKCNESIHIIDIKQKLKESAERRADSDVGGATVDRSPDLLQSNL